jgi:ribosomal protein L7/L12
MADLAKIVDDLSKLTVLEAAELSKLLEEKWGVSAAAPVAVAAAAGGGAAAAAPVEEKTEFDVVLTGSGEDIAACPTYRQGRRSVGSRAGQMDPQLRASAARRARLHKPSVL